MADITPPAATSAILSVQSGTSVGQQAVQTAIPSSQLSAGQLLEGLVSLKEGAGSIQLSTSIGTIVLRVPIELERFLSQGTRVLMRMEGNEGKAARLIQINNTPVEQLLQSTPRSTQAVEIVNRPPNAEPLPPNLTYNAKGQMAALQQAIATGQPLPPNLETILTRTTLLAATPDQRQALLQLLMQSSGKELALPRLGDGILLRVLPLPGQPLAPSTPSATPPQTLGTLPNVPSASTSMPVASGTAPPTLPAAGSPLPPTAGVAPSPSSPLQAVPTAPAVMPAPVTSVATSPAPLSTPSPASPLFASTPTSTPAAPAPFFTPTSPSPYLTAVASLPPAPLTTPPPGFIHGVTVPSPEAPLTSPLIIHTPVGSFQAPASPDIKPHMHLLLHIAAIPQLAEEGGHTPTATKWPALQEALTLLHQSNTTLASSLLQKLPQINPGFLPAALLFISALSNSNGTRQWLGDPLLNALDEIGRPELGTRLTQDMNGISQLWQHKQEEGWQTTLLPLWHNAKVEFAELYMKRKPSPGPDQPEQTRFVIEVQLSHFGPMQFDGFYQSWPQQRTHDKKFSLLVRTLRAMEEEPRQMIRQLFNRSLENSALIGTVDFQVMEQFPTAPMEASINQTLQKLMF